MEKKNNLSIYNQVRAVPNDAQKKITGGRLSGKTDINPMWRIKVLTEQFGPCGIGWYYELTRLWLEPGANNEVAGFCNINLYVKYGENWSKPIAGTGGSVFIAKEKNGLYTSDEVYKMALTDAISVACKALGIGADVYWGADKTKYDAYTKQPEPEEATPKAEPKKEDKSPAQIKESDIAGMELDIESSKNREEILAKWNKYKKYDTDKRITKAVQRVCEKLGIEE